MAASPQQSMRLMEQKNAIKKELTNMNEADVDGLLRLIEKKKAVLEHLHTMQAEDIDGLLQHISSVKSRKNEEDTKSVASTGTSSERQKGHPAFAEDPSIR